MNKYLLMSAAAAVAATAGGGVAQASTTVTFGSYCDYYIVNTAGGGLWAAVHVAPACSSGYVLTAGAHDRKDKAISGPSVQFADPTFGYIYAYPAGLDFALGTPFTTSAWAIVFSSNGSSAYILNSGVQGNKVKPGAKQSTLSKAIAALKLAKK